MSRPSNRRAAPGAAASIAGHLVVLFALVSVRAEPPAPRPDATERIPVTVTLMHPPRPVPPPKPEAPAKPAPARAPVKTPAPAPAAARPAAAKPLPHAGAVRPSHSQAAAVLPAAASPAAGSGTELTGAQIAGAATAGSGSDGDGACNMARLLQRALRKDPLVRAALAGSTGKALLVWNGDWVQGHGEDGKGLAAVREAILWEVGFAPKACRSAEVHGLVLISLNDAPGAPRLALGAGDWRWSDLLAAR